VSYWVCRTDMDHVLHAVGSGSAVHAENHVAVRFGVRTNQNPILVALKVNVLKRITRPIQRKCRTSYLGATTRPAGCTRQSMHSSGRRRVELHASSVVVEGIPRPAGEIGVRP